MGRWCLREVTQEEVLAGEWVVEDLHFARDFLSCPCNQGSFIITVCIYKLLAVLKEFKLLSFFVYTHVSLSSTSRGLEMDKTVPTSLTE